ncbi:acyl-CoA N-acyltransferase [Lenzites betulinus]|nr:acyl-CoA N-acyltransferase [Lenzites betulinus]
MVTSKLTRKANKASAADIAEVAGITATWQTFKGKPLRVRVATGPSLSKDLRKEVWDLWETNMRALMEPSSFGWEPQEKRKELFHRNARFILVFEDDAGEDAGGALTAFSKFRFEWDELEADDWLYCYELQVSEAYRNAGLGRFFVEKLTTIGKHWGMSKIMLTVLKSNAAARQFYGKTGFEVDPISPEHDSATKDDALQVDTTESLVNEQKSTSGDDDDDAEQETIDYEILSKVLA